MKNVLWLILGIVVMSCSQDDEDDIITGPIIPEDIIANYTIEELFDNFQSTGIIEEDSVGISAFVISTDEFANISNELYLKDQTGTLIVEVESDSLFATFPVGQEIELFCTGLMIDVESRTMKSLTGAPIPRDSLLLRTEITDNIINVSATNLDFSDGLSNENIGDYIFFLSAQFNESAIGEPLANQPGITIRPVSGSSGDPLKVVFRENGVFADEIVPAGRGLIGGVVKMLGDELVLIPVSTEDVNMPLTRRAPFVKAQFEFNGNTLPYQIMYPRDYDPSGSYPLVIFLHGAGERGTNNTSQMVYGPETFGSYEARTDYPAIVIFPQCPSDVMWSRRTKENTGGTWVFEFPVEEEPNYAMEMVIELTRDMIENEAVDAERIYVAGLSMGGIGVFEYFYYAPDLPAAGVSIAGGHDPELISTYGEGKSFWLFHGTDDTVVPILYSSEMYDKFVELGIDADFTEAVGRGHEWNYVLNDPQMIEWLFQQ